MLQVESIIKVADNTGAKTLKILSIPGFSKKKYAHAGDVVSVVVKEAAPHAQVGNAAIVRAVIVRTRKERKRADGTYVRFDDNAAVIVNKNGDPVGARVLGPIAREVKDKGYKKIASLAKEVW